MNRNTRLEPKDPNDLWEAGKRIKEIAEIENRLFDDLENYQAMPTQVLRSRIDRYKLMYSKYLVA